MQCSHPFACGFICSQSHMCNVPSSSPSRLMPIANCSRAGQTARKWIL
jgi:hypothetical protein